MKIIVRKAGGVSGTQRPPAHLDSSSLSDGQQDELQALLEASKFWELPEDLPGDPHVRDTLSTILEVDDGARRHAVAFEFPTAPAALREFVSKVRAWTAGRGPQG